MLKIIPVTPAKIVANIITEQHFTTSKYNTNFKTHENRNEGSLN